ncbi:MAG: DUF177 domain-containing protein [Desulfotalea sp.]
MKISFREIKDQTIEYSCSGDGWFAWPDNIKSGEIVATVFLSRKETSLVELKGRFEGNCKTACDRCGVSLIHEISEGFTYLLSEKAESEVEFPETECDLTELSTIYLGRDVIDVDFLLKEESVISVPAQILCSNECKGICYSCGVSLNYKPCQCEEDYSDSPFAVLKKLSQR